MTEAPTSQSIFATIPPMPPPKPNRTPSHVLSNAPSSSTLSPQSSSSTSTLTNANDECDGDQLALLGPAIRIHRYDIGIRLLQFFVFFWLLAGCSFIICVVLCSFVSLGYVTFKSTGITFLVVCAFVFYSFFLFKMLRALLRTFVRISMAVWREQFGAGSKDFILLRWVDHVAVYLTQGSSIDPETIEMRVEYIKTFILFFLILIFIGVPLITVASIYGYWTIVSVLCALLTLGSASIIVLVNISSRLFRALRFYATIWRNSSNHESSMTRLRAAYVASTGNDHGRSILNVMLEKCIGAILLLMLCSFVFSGFKFKPSVLIFCACVLFVLIIVRLRKCSKCCKCRVGAEELDSADEMSDSPVSSQSLLVRSLNHLENNDYYDGKSWQQVILIFILRFVLIFFGLTCLIYLDMNEVISVDGSKPIDLNLNSSSNQLLIWLAFSFFCVTMLKDLIFFTSIMYFPLRPFLLALLQLSQLGIALAGDILLTGFTFTCCTIMAIYEIDYRDGRWFWKKDLRKKVHSKSQKRAMRNSFMILTMVGIILLISVLVGMTVGLLKTPQMEQNLDDIWERVNLAASARPNQISAPVCSTSFTTDRVSVLDLATMSTAAYEFNATQVLNVLHQNPRLKGWTLGLYSLDNSNTRPVSSYEPNKTVENINITTGVRFAEFISPTNVSVIAIRGTFKLEDLFQDLYMWSTVALLQTSSYFGTFVNAWPVETVAYVNYLITEFAAYPNLMYYQEMESIVNDIMKYKEGRFGFGRRNDKMRVMVTGHSLGGGLASIVAAHLGIYAVTFSAPGLGYSTVNYNLTQEAVMQYTVNIIPMQDPVAAFDKQIGLEQHVKCDAGMPMACHSIERTIQTLSEMCGVEALV